jgi:glycosyltransferase involved in cell wall biosynthesis
LHQENHGLAYVRNICIVNAKGEYISFIDSDDYVLQGLYSYALDLIEKYNYDILCFKHIDVYGEQDELICVNDNKDAELKQFSTDEALNCIFFDKYIDVITCNKIIKKSLFENIEYPEGKLYEDMFTTYKYISKAKLILCTDVPFYVYCHRAGSIGQSKFNEKSMDLFYAAKETYEFICKNTLSHDEADVGFLYWTVVVANMMIKSNYSDNKFFKYASRMARCNIKNIHRCELLKPIRKFELTLIGVNIVIYKWFYKTYMYFMRKKM